ENLIVVKDPRVDKINWGAPKVYGVKPCVGRWNDNGTITMQPYSVQAGCTEYNFLIRPRYAPRFSTDRDPRIRLHTGPQPDVSFIKNTRVTDSTTLQFRAEIFNISNTYMYHRQNFVNDPENSNFGSIIPATVGYGEANFPRQIQLAVKFVW